MVAFTEPTTHAASDMNKYDINSGHGPRVELLWRWQATQPATAHREDIYSGVEVGRVGRHERNEHPSGSQAR